MIVHFVALGAAGIAAITDARTGKIPNWLTLPLVPAGIVLNLVESGSHGALAACAGALLCFFVPYLMFWTTRGNAIGGGDVKLFAGLGALLGPGAGLEVQLGSFVALLVVALFTLAWRGLLMKTLTNSYWLFANRFLPATKRRALDERTMTSMRMGPAILIACTASLLLLQ